MKQALPLMLALSLVLAPSACAQMLIGWGDSPTNGAPTSQLFDCQSNTGSQTLVVSLVPPVDILGANGFSLDVKVATWGGVTGPGFSVNAVYPLPEYWDFAPGGCRAGAFTLGVNLLGLPLLESSPVSDPWQGAISVGGWSTEVVSGQGGPAYLDAVTYGHFKLNAAVPIPVDLLAGQEYYMGTFTIRNSRSTTCAGCCVAMAFLPTASVSRSLSGPYVFGAGQGMAFWQDPPSCSPVPTRTRTWGGLKSVYR